MHARLGPMHGPLHGPTNNIPSTQHLRRNSWLFLLHNHNIRQMIKSQMLYR